MLRRVNEYKERNYEVRIGDVEGSPLFKHHPEFNPPSHGVWNIVHVGMLLPEAHQIYVCGINCMRGVVLTAAEMGASERFSMVLLEEDDLMNGSVEDVTLEGVKDVLNKMPKLPPAVMVFTVCTHRFLGCDLDYIYHNLEKSFPTVHFLRCFMEPITQKEGLTPDQRLRKTMFDLLPQSGAIEKTVVILGSDFSLDENADLRRMFTKNGWKLLEIQDCKTFDEYLQMGQAEVILSTFPRARYGAEETAKRLSRRHIYLPGSFSYKEIERMEIELSTLLGLEKLDCNQEEVLCDEALDAAKKAADGKSIVIDYTFHSRPLGLARLLLEHGFHVTKVYLDAVSGEEMDDFNYLREHAQNLLICATTQPERRMLPRGSEKNVLALGQMAAWEENTPWFVNMVEGGGLWGYDGICHLAGMMIEALENKKDTKDLVPRKGLGCKSLI